MNLASLFKADPFRFRRLAEKVDREMSHCSDALVKNNTGYSRAELAKEVAAEVEREQSQAAVKAKKLRADAEAALIQAAQAEAESEAQESHKRGLVDKIRIGLDAIERLQADIDSHPKLVAAAKAEMARAASDNAIHPDDVSALQILNGQAQNLAVLPHYLDAAKTALQLVQAEVQEAQRELSKIK